MPVRDNQNCRLTHMQHRFYVFKHFIDKLCLNGVSLVFVFAFVIYFHTCKFDLHGIALPNLVN